jgi:pimeloyl-ACP methyl ester carboxylesterase
MPRDSTVAAVPAPAVAFLDIGLRLRYRDWGGDGPPVLFLHGGGLDGSAWDAVCEALGDDCRCIALDQRGHGASAWAPDADYSLAAYVADLAAVVAALELDAPTIVGQSMGAMNALGFAVLHQPRLTALAFVDASPIRLNAAKADRWLTVVQQRRPDTATYDPAAMEIAAIQGHRAEAAALAPRLGAVTCPALVINGAISPIISRDEATQFTAGLARGELVVVPDAGHNVQFDQPEALAALVRRSVARRS